MSWDKEERAWAYLSRVIEGPSRPLQSLLAKGAQASEIVAAVRARKEWVRGLDRQVSARRDWAKEEQDLVAATEVGGRLIYPGHKEWPAEVLGSAFGFAESGLSPHLRSHQADAVTPHALWVRGADLGALTAQAVSVVGTRAVTSYGTAATRQIVRGMAAHRWTVISGGALGVDAVAHEEALAAGGTTLAVAACGIDRHYPARNASLVDRILDSGGGLISEYPPGTSPQRHRFLTRNRLVAALSAGTVVIEAAWRSGALNTLTWASAFGRAAMAVPGPITSTGSLGCHDRIKKGQAQLVTSAEDVRGLLSAIGEVDPDKQLELSFGADSIQELSRPELRVYDALPESGGSLAEQVSTGAGLPLPLVVHLLVELKSRGIVSLDGSEWSRAA